MKKIQPLAALSLILLFNIAQAEDIRPGLWRHPRTGSRNLLSSPNA